MLDIQHEYIIVRARRTAVATTLSALAAVIVLFSLTATVSAFVSSHGASSSQGASEASADKIVADPKMLETMESIKHLRNDLALLNKDSLIIATATQRRAKMHALSPDFSGAFVLGPIPPPAGYVIGGRVAANTGLLKATVIDMHTHLCKVAKTANTVVIPNEVDVEVCHRWMLTLALIEQAIKHYNQLEQLCFQPKVDSLRLGKETLVMYEDTGRAQRLSKSVYTSLKKASQGEQNVLLVGKKRNTY